MKDLTKGSPLKLVLEFALPIGIGNIFQQFYSMADTRIVGTYLGEQALAAVGATNSLNNMIVGFLLGMTNGYAIIVARKFGAGDERTLKRAVAATFELGIVVSIIMTLLSLGFLRPIFEFLNTPEHLMDSAMAYFIIILYGMTALMLYNVVSGILRAIGDSITPLCFLIGSTFVNVGLDIYFINSLHMGVVGAALATVMSQLGAFILCLIYMWIKYPVLRFKLSDFIPEKSLMSEMIPTGFSMGFMISFINVGSVALQTGINSFGEKIIVAHTAARKLSDMFMMPFIVFGTAMATFSGQNIGADRPDRVKLALKQVLYMNFAWCALVLIIVYTCVPTLIYLITDTTTPEVLQTASLYLRVNCILYFITAVIIILRNTMQGIGDSATPIVSSFVELLTKVVVAITLVKPLGYWAIILAEPISWVLMVIPLLIKFRANPLMKNSAKAGGLQK